MPTGYKNTVSTNSVRTLNMQAAGKLHTHTSYDVWLVVCEASSLSTGRVVHACRLCIPKRNY